MLTDIVYRLLPRHMLCDSGEHVYGVDVAKHRAAQVGVVANEHPRVQLAREEMPPRVVEERLGEALEAEPLVDIAQLLRLKIEGAHA